jgi:methionyl-tRNA formyltransferase
MKIVFMGTPEFAVPSLNILLENGFDVVGVITSTDKYGGRGGKKLIESAVKQFAVSKGLKILQPKNLKAPEFIDELKSLNADLQIVVAFRMLPEVVWNMPKLGTYNLHGSLLPKYRGAAPINWAIINGEKETGVTSFKLKHEIDTGDILFQEKIEIHPEENAGDIHDKMMELGAKVILKTVKAIEKGNVTFTKQDNSLVSKAPKLNSDNCQIDFCDSTVNIFNKIRGLSPYPGAFTYIDDKICKIYKCEQAHDNIPPHEIQTDNKNYLKIGCSDGCISVLELQLAGKKKMTIKELLNGYNIESNKISIPS